MTSTSSMTPKQGSLVGSDSLTAVEQQKADERKTLLDLLKIYWSVVLVMLVAAVLLLVFLPLSAVLIMNASGCCLANGPENVITFWASMIAGFLALFGMVITGVFIITSLRTDATARAEAKSAADEALDTYIRRHKAQLFKQMEDGAKEILKQQREVINTITAARDQVVNSADEAQTKISGARRQVERTHEEAIPAISAARKSTQDAAAEAQQQVGAANRQVERGRTEAIQAISNARVSTQDAATEAQSSIDAEHQDVQRRRGTALQTIDSLEDAVRSAAQATLGRIDRINRRLDEVGGDPEQPDE